MSKQDRHITVFEHERLRFDQGENRISKDLYEALERFHGDGTPYFKLIHNGVQFNEFVGVIQVGGTLIEVLPKADRRINTLTKKEEEAEENRWRDILIDMMRAVSGFDIRSTSEAHLRVRPNTILELYFELFIREVEYLLHTGLAKKYRKKEGNVTALKGALQFGKHIQQNLTHGERFYVKHTVYDVEHQLHAILYKTIRLLRHINTNAGLHSRIGALLLNFPEMPDLRVTEATFEKMVFNRKTQRYQKAIEIAKLLLLNYHPDVSRGRRDVLALMFDMNLLWEQFVVVSLRKYRKEGEQVHAQKSRSFWKPDGRRGEGLQPDVWIEKGSGKVVLDTKWKNLGGSNPSSEDLRQMYAYSHYFESTHVALVYPGTESTEIEGRFVVPGSRDPGNVVCSIIQLAVPTLAVSEKSIVRKWQEQIAQTFENWPQNGG